MIYERGTELGNFKFFADDLVATELSSYSKDHIHIKNIERRDAFFNLLLHPGLKIKELHIFSHSIGGGLFPGYKDTSLDNDRGAASDNSRGGRANYFSVMNAEKGAILTDDFIRKPYSDYRNQIRTNFASDAKIKIWGCNSGVSGWRYSDEGFQENERVYDLDTPAKIYYRRALNEYNSPKPAVAQAFANYSGVPTFGAGSGTSIQVMYQGRWVSKSDFIKKTHRRSVNEADVLRLAPDRGDYNEF